MRERRPGVWELVVQLPRDATTARAPQLSRTVQGTKREAQRALAALVAEVSAGKVSASNATLSELLVRWLEVVDDQLSPTTVREYRRLVRTMLDPDLGKLSLRKVTTQRLDAYYASLVRERELSPASIRHIHAVLRGALGQGVKWGWIPTNPAAAASPPKLRHREITPPAIADTRALLLAADEHDPEFGALLRVIAATGARRGEVCGLRWSGVDFDAGTVLIRRSIASVAGGTVEKDTKTHAARRIAVDAETLAVLMRQRQRMQARAAACRLPFNAAGFVFTANGRWLAAAAPRHDHQRLPTALRSSRDQRGEAARLAPSARHPTAGRRRPGAHRQRPTRPRQRVDDVERVRPFPRGERPGGGQRHRRPLGAADATIRHH